ncbi:MAG: hypothetical protein ACFFG0_52315, partial [Candidatus Thorarchaeota archaeon]
MKEAKNPIRHRNLIITSYITIILNLFCIVFAILYLLNPEYLILWDIYGVILYVTIFENLLYVYFNIHKRNILRVKTQFISYGYLLFIIIGIVCMMLGNLLLSSIYSNELIDTIGAYLLIYFSYFGILIYGFSFAIYNIKILRKADLSLFQHITLTINVKKLIRVRRISRKILVILSRTIFIIGIVFALVIIIGSFEVVTTFIAIISGQFGVFFSIIFLANTLLLLKLRRRKRINKKYYRTAILGFFVSGCLLMPLFMTN